MLRTRTGNRGAVTDIIIKEMGWDKWYKKSNKLKSQPKRQLTSKENILAFIMCVIVLAIWIWG